MRRALALLLWLLMLNATTLQLFPPFAFADDRPLGSLSIFPPAIELWHVGDSQSVHAYQTRLGSNTAPIAMTEALDANVRWISLNPNICRFENQQVIAVADGTTAIVAEWTDAIGKKHTTRASVVVRHPDPSVPLEFENDVQSILARYGCNSGACHGALAGKGGFRLSLRGYDSPQDYQQIVQADHGRRVELADPGSSLLLAKASGTLPHQGGRRLPTDSQDFKRLALWLAQGAKSPSPQEPKLVALEVSPAHLELQPGQQVPLQVTAKYDNGRIRDVTSWAKFNASDEAVAKVDEQGNIRVLGPGQSAIVVWFGSRIQLSRLTVPFPYQVPSQAYDAFPIANQIDQHLLNQWKQLRLAPSSRCSDHEFIRRVFLDTLGILPSSEEVDAFVASDNPLKRKDLIQSVLQRPEFADYWAYRWSDVLMLNGNLIRPEPMRAYYQWIRQSVAENKPWDQMVREIVVARGDATVQGETNFYALNQDPESMTENVCQAFLGLSIGCAKCHNHPLEKWTNDQYYAMANLFARVRGKGWGGDGREGDGLRTVVVLDRGDVIQPLKGKPQPPAPLDAPPLDPNSPRDRRIDLANWLTSPNNPYFTKAIVNRVWANFFGVGMVQPVDDLRMSNPAANEPLFENLAQFLVDHHYDLKALMQLVLESETYQRSSDTLPENRLDARVFTHYYPKRLMAEVIHDAICQVTGVPTRFQEIEYLGADKRPTDFYPIGTRAIQLYDSAVSNYFLKTFGRNQRRITCECERSDEPSVVQVLHLSNGSTLNEKLAHPNAILSQWLADPAMTLERMVDRAYLMALSRSPSSAERQALVSELQAIEGDERRKGLEDLLWGLLTSREFLFNH